LNDNEELQSGFPDWLTEDYKLMEPAFCWTFLREHPMRCIRGRFYTVDRLVTDESSLKKKIYEQISPWLEIKIARKVDELLNTLRMAAYSKPLALERDRIHVANSTLFVDGRFSPEKAYCNNRLTVRAITLMCRRRRSGCAFWRSYSIQKMFPSCRSTWATACSPPPKARRC